MPFPFEAQMKAGGTTHSRIFGNEKQDASGNQYSRNAEENVSETKAQYNTSPNKTHGRNMEDMQNDTGRAEPENANFPGENTHCRIFGSGNTTPKQSEKKDTARAERPSPREHCSLAADESCAQETSSASGHRQDEVNTNTEENVVDHGKEAEDAHISKSILRKRKTDLQGRQQETPGKARNNPREGTHNRIFGSISAHDKNAWITSPSVDPKSGYKPFKPQAKTLFTASSPVKEREISTSKKEDTHTRIFGKVGSKCRDLAIAPPIYPKVDSDDRSTQSRIFGPTESPAREPKPKIRFQNEGDRNPNPGALSAKFDKQLTDLQEPKTSSLPEMQQEFKNLQIPPAEGTLGEKN